MRDIKKMTMEEKYQIVISNDQSYDNQLLYGVKSTKIFCRPSCNSRKPLRKNTVFFISNEEAISQGYRPCKRCRPDRELYRPDEDLVAEVKKYIDLHFREGDVISQLPSDFSISMNHLRRVFKWVMKQTLNQYLIKKRIDEAKCMLKQSDFSIIEIVYKSGFKSSSNFYKCFKGITGMTPREFRKNS